MKHYMYLVLVCARCCLEVHIWLSKDGYVRKVYKGGMTDNNTDAVYLKYCDRCYEVER